MRHTIMGGRKVAVFIAALLVVLAVGAVGRAHRGESIRADAPPTRAQLVASLPRTVSIARIRKHLVALQRIADRHGGTRVAGSPGYAASVRYVQRALAGAGYRPRVAPFPFVEYEELVERGQQLAPVRRSIELEAIDYSPSTPPGGIQERIVQSSGSGCSASDFPQAKGRIALVERGTCFIADKAHNAQAAGALALLVFATERGPINATLGDPERPRFRSRRSISPSGGLFRRHPTQSSGSRLSRGSGERPRRTLSRTRTSNVVACCSSARTSTPFSSVLALTTTEPALRHCSRSPASSSSGDRGWPSASRSGAPRSSDCSARVLMPTLPDGRNWSRTSTSTCSAPRPRASRLRGPLRITLSRLLSAARPPQRADRPDWTLGQPLLRADRRSDGWPLRRRRRLLPPGL